MPDKGDYLLPSRAFHLQLTAVGAEFETEVQIAQLCGEDEAVAIYAIQYSVEQYIQEAASVIEACIKCEFERNGVGVYINGAPSMSNHVVHGARWERATGGEFITPESFYAWPKPLVVANNMKVSAIKWGGASLPMVLVRFWYKTFKVAPLQRRFIRGKYG